MTQKVIPVKGREAGAMGLGAVVKKIKYPSNGRIFMIPVEDILPNPDQPRKEFGIEKLLELAQSISENGLVQPVTVVFNRGQPILVAGERRLRAAKIAGIGEIPCIEMENDPRKTAILALLENMQREDLNCFEVAEGIRNLIQIHGLTQDETAAQLGCSQSTIANRLRLLRLTSEERMAIVGEGLSERHARALVRIEDVSVRKNALGRVIRDGLNVAQTEKLVEDTLAGNVRRRRPITLIRDVRLFINTFNHAVDTMRRSGIKASAEKTETEEYIEYVVRIPKGEALLETGS